MRNTEDNRDHIMSPEDEAKETGVIILLIVGLLIIIGTTSILFLPFLYYGIFGKLSFTFWMLVVDVPIIYNVYKQCFPNIRYNEVAFINNSFLKTSRTVVFGIRPVLPEPIEKVHKEDLDVTHNIRNDPEDEYATIDQHFVTADALLTARPDAGNLKQYSKYKKIAIDEQLKVQLSNLLKSFIQTRNALDILPSSEHLDPEKDPFEKAFREFPWEPFEKEYGVRVISAKMDSVKLPTIITDASNKKKVMKEFISTAKTLMESEGLTKEQAVQAAILVWKDREELVNISQGLSGIMGGRFAPTASPRKNKNRRKNGRQR